MPQIHIQCYEEHTDAQKVALVRDITKTVAAAAVVDPMKVQVQFYPIPKGNRSLGGRLMSEVEDLSKLPADETPWLIVQLQLFEGRSLDQKRAIVKGATEDISRNFGIDPERIMIIISEMNRIHNAIGGRLAIDR
ncbi:MAG: tautomerase family protein [Deltaproteobacteria bacterium]|nr:tautomerase family protein [Deltaproteobacteria bacterium]